jgi:hypothetical protein
MRDTDVIGIVGGGLLIAGIVFGIADSKLFDHWYDWVFGPFFWMTGCTLMIAWIFGRLNQQSKPQRLKHGRTSIGFFQVAETTLEPAHQRPERRREERRREERRKSASAA